MALIDVRCSGKKPHTTEVHRPIRMWPKTPPCPECGAPTEQIHLPPRARWTIDPIVVFRAPDGTLRVPGDPTSPMTKKYARFGYERIELRSAAEVRRFEQQENSRELSLASRRTEHREQMRELREAESRRSLRSAMEHMSERGRDLARAMMAQNDRAPRARTRDPGCHFEVFSFDRSNRMESRSPDGRRRRD